MRRIESTRSWPRWAPPFVLACSLALALVSAWLAAREMRAPPPVWTLAPHGLVRERGGEVRTIPWSRTHGIGVRPRPKGSASTGGAVAFAWSGVSIVPIRRVEEGLVADYGSWLIDNVPDPKELTDEMLALQRAATRR